uniref:Movement protein TGBp3 n=1 Tax=Nerine latent virus TaxID=797075 RepID=A0A2K9ZXK7_9VIRU|nr:triple gene block 3 [Nerine latent virus]
MLPKLPAPFYLIVPLTSVLTYFLLFALFPQENKCTVIITGESIKILGCVFNEQFIDYAKRLDVLRV